MIRRATIFVLFAAACHSSPSKSVDAPAAQDAATTPDGSRADAANADASVDAPATSSVIVVPNCTGVSTGDIGVNITTSGLTFSPSTATITAGQYVKFTTTGTHNFQNQPGAPADSTFNSGTPGPQTSCLKFTTAGSFPFECVVHASMGMTGTLTVN
jgi:plastocyanin